MCHGAIGRATWPLARAAAPPALSGALAVAEDLGLAERNSSLPGCLLPGAAVIGRRFEIQENGERGLTDSGNRRILGSYAESKLSDDRTGGRPLVSTNRHLTLLIRFSFNGHGFTMAGTFSKN